MAPRALPEFTYENSSKHATLHDVVRCCDVSQLEGSPPQPIKSSRLNDADESGKKLANAPVVAVSFVLVQPNIDGEVVAAALKEVPDALRACPNDTWDALQQRLCSAFCWMTYWCV